jgi:hypothetical protein
METKKRGFKQILDSYHQTSWNFVGISTVVCGSFWGVEKNQNGGRCHGNQGAKNVKFTPYSNPNNPVVILRLAILTPERLSR